MKKIAVFTSGGDAPGMNACIRSVVRTAVYNNLEVVGIKDGFQGMIDDSFIPFTARSVANIIQRGGTILRTARSEAFRTKEGREQAFNNLQKHAIDGIVCIGGDGSFEGSEIFSTEFSIPIIGIPGTIDNDISGTDFTLGFDTAVNTVVECVDKLRDTASSHKRLFIVEVMGRDAGNLAMHAGIACGAEDILIPETPTYISNLIEKLKSGRSKNKLSGIVLVSEGDEFGGAYKVAEAIKNQLPEYELRVSVLGHLQRGGSPTANDRLLGSILGNAAVEHLLKGNTNQMVGMVKNEVICTPFSQALKGHARISDKLIELNNILAI